MLLIEEEQPKAQKRIAGSEMPRDTEEMEASQSNSAEPEGGNARESDNDAQDKTARERPPSTSGRAPHKRQGQRGEGETTNEAKAGKKRGKKRAPRQTKKDPKAPKRFKSSYIFFAQKKYKEIESELTEQGTTDKSTVDITKMVSSAWRNLSPEEKSPYEEMSNKDKARFEVERSLYKGTWTVPVGHKRTQAIGAPKRPESAFLAFSNKKRANLKLQMPNATNGDISKMLAKMWNEAPDDIRQKYQDAERQLREKYKIDVAEWRAEEDAKLQERQDNARRLADSGAVVAQVSIIKSRKARRGKKKALGNEREDCPQKRRRGLEGSVTVESSGGRSQKGVDSQEVSSDSSHNVLSELRPGQSSAAAGALSEAVAIASAGGGSDMAETINSNNRAHFSGALQGRPALSASGMADQQRLLYFEELELARRQTEHHLLMESALLDPQTRLRLKLSGHRGLPSHVLDDYLGIFNHGGALHGSPNLLRPYPLEAHDFRQGLRANQLALDSERRMMRLAATSELPESALNALQTAELTMPDSIASQEAMLRREQLHLEGVLSASAAQRQIMEGHLYDATLLPHPRGYGASTHMGTGLGAQGVVGRSLGHDAMILALFQGGRSVLGVDADPILASELAMRGQALDTLRTSPLFDGKRPFGLTCLAAGSNSEGDSCNGATPEPSKLPTTSRRMKMG